MKSERLKDIAWTSSAEIAMNFMIPGNKVNSRFSRAFAAKFLISADLRKSAADRFLLVVQRSSVEN